MDAFPETPLCPVRPNRKPHQLAVALLCLCGLAAQAAPQTAYPTAQSKSASALGPSGSRPSCVVKVLDRGELAGAVRLGFRGTALAPEARGEGEFEATKNHAGIKAAFAGLPPATRFGSQYLTYVLWAITPAGRARNLSEIEVNGQTGKVDAKAGFKAFGLIVTAEPYFAVTQPSEIVVLETEFPTGTSGKIKEAKCDLLPREHYPPNPDVPPAVPGGVDPQSALALDEARYALFMARSADADRYAPETLKTAEQLLKQAETGAAGNLVKKLLDETSRAATLIAEDARVLAVRRAERASQPN